MSQHSMPFGARLLPAGGARFRLWAPTAGKVSLVCSAGPQTGEVAMTAQADGWFEADLARASTDTRYGFRINDDQQVVPDPASRSNPDDVHGPSALTDPGAFAWPDESWRGRPWHEAVIYELHVGCFTSAGTFTAAIDQLDDLVALGITAIELMPVADFPGRCGWGYDGVLLFAPDASYGHPDDLKRLVAAAHQRGLMVLLDVVYNHFGPDGNYLGMYAAPFFDESQHTPWGAAINFGAARSRNVREFFIHNALYWLEEFRLDGLRLDAVHAMRDASTPHFVDELAQRVRNGPGRERHVHLVLENEINDAARLTRGPADSSGRQPAILSDAQWNDDVHHAIHVLVTGETDGYYADFADQPIDLLGRALAGGFAFQGQASPYRDNEARGTRSTHLPPLAFVNSTQTHDQIGNRAFGERIASLAREPGQQAALRALLACLLLSPPVPMLFMGEEYAAAQPFLYFCDFQGELARAVTDGRRNEFGRFGIFADPSVRDRIPDPNAAASFEASKLRWAERDRDGHRQWLDLYRQLLGIRHRKLMPHLAQAASGEYRLLSPGLLAVDWPLGSAIAPGPSLRLHLQANLTDRPIRTDIAPPPGESLYDSHPDDGATPAWSVRVTLQTT